MNFLLSALSISLWCKLKWLSKFCFYENLERTKQPIHPLQIQKIFFYICCIAVIHIQLYTYTCRNKINNKDERTHFFRKIYLSHFIRNGCERVMCERWVGDWTNCNILTPSSFVFSSTSFSFCWAAQSGVLRAHSLLLGAGSLHSILSPIRLTPTPTNWTCLSHQVI